MTRKKVDYFTYSQISESFGVTKSGLQHRVHRLGLKGRTLSGDGTIYFTQKQVEKIVDCYQIRGINHPRKLDVIELYQAGRKGRDIAVILRMSVKASYDCIREYNNNGHIIVESKLNNRFV
jgi:hypothetical protein